MTTIFLMATELLSTGEFILPDGTLWSHAASYGDVVQGESRYKIDAPTVDNFVRCFNSGIRAKVPVDYDHGSETATDGSRPIPKAGTVLELAHVKSTADLNETMRAMIKAAGRKLSDERNLGLWARWRPTETALGLVQRGEYTEMSIAWRPEYQNGQTGKAEGPTISSIALTNIPHKNEMIPIAASCGTGGGRADTPEQENQTMPEQQNAMLSLALACGRTVPFGSQEEAAETARTEIVALRQQKADQDTAIVALSKVVDAVKHEMGEADPEKAIERLKALKTEANAGKAEAAQQRALNRAQAVRTVLAKYEQFMTVPTQRIYERELTRELEEGKEIGKTETEKALASLRMRGPTGGQFSAVNAPDAPPDADGKLTKLADTIVKEDARLAEMAKTNPNGAFTIALRQARRQING